MSERGFIMASQHDAETEALTKERHELIESIETVNQCLPNARTKEDKEMLKRQKKIFTERLQSLNIKLKSKGLHVNNYIREILSESFDNEKFKLLLEEANNRARHGISKPFPLVFMTDKDQENLEQVKVLKQRELHYLKQISDLQDHLIILRTTLMKKIEVESDFSLRKTYSELLKLMTK